MTKITNLLDSLYNTDTVTSEDDKKRMLKLSINALTGITCGAMMSHLFRERAGMADIEISIDGRNELDAKSRGTELKAENMFDNGYGEGMPLKTISQIANGIRVALYDELHRFGDFPHKNALYVTPVTGITERPNYDLPMSAQLYMEFRSRPPVGVNEREVEAIVKRRGTSITADTVREILLEDARKSAKRVADIAPNVLAELGSYTDQEEWIVNDTTGMAFPAHKPDAFTSLPLETQVQFAETLQRSLQREFERLLPRSLRDVDIAGECDLIELHLKSLRGFINETEHDMRFAA